MIIVIHIIKEEDRINREKLYSNFDIDIEEKTFQ